MGYADEGMPPHDAVTDELRTLGEDDGDQPRKKRLTRRALLACACAAVGVGALVAAPQAYRVYQRYLRSQRAHGTCGTVSWSLYDDGELHLEPASGDEGVLPSSHAPSDWPWDECRDSIRRVTSAGTIRGAESMYFMFAGCSQLSNVSALLGWDVSSATDMGSMFFRCPGTPPSWYHS